MEQVTRAAETSETQEQPFWSLGESDEAVKFVPARHHDFVDIIVLWIASMIEKKNRSGRVHS